MMSEFGVLTRLDYGLHQTLGILQTFEGSQENGFARINDVRTMELPWRKNERRISCIPEGDYTVIKHNAPKFGPCFWLQDVPDRSEILIHSANFWRDLLGCIGPGLGFSDIDKDGLSDVYSSKTALKQLLGAMPDEWILSIRSRQNYPAVGPAADSLT